MKYTLLLLGIIYTISFSACGNLGAPSNGSEVKILGYADTSVYTEEQRKKYGDPSRDVTVVVFTLNDDISYLGAIPKEELSGKTFPLTGSWTNANVCACGCDDMNVVTVRK